MPLLLIFKLVESGTIIKYVLTIFLEMGFYALQKKAWMDEAMMLKWIKNCLVSWKDMLPPEVIPYLILDSFHISMMGPKDEQIIKVHYIPIGCTYLCQPIGVESMGQ